MLIKNIFRPGGQEGQTEILETLVEKAMDYGKKMYLSKDRNIFDKVTEQTKEHEIQRFARNWCVQNYFDSIGIDIILNNIKVEHFT